MSVIQYESIGLVIAIAAVFYAFWNIMHSPKQDNKVILSWLICPDCGEHLQYSDSAYCCKCGFKITVAHYEKDSS